VEYAILDDAVRDRQQDAELSIGMLFNLFRHCLGARWLPAAIHLMHARPAGRTRYEDLLGVRPLFDQSSNRILFRRGDLECPMPRQDERLMRLLEAELRKQLPAGTTGADIVARARHEIALALDSTDLELATISRRCGMQSWTLKRKLKEQGTTFQDLVAATRYELAIAQFARGVPITEVAMALGYSEVSAFSRAFRQWTGKSPRNFISSRSHN
jgi:AraC-like DNA-binding protein